MVKIEFEAGDQKYRRDHVDNLKRALDSASQSPHPSNPIGATLVGHSPGGQVFRITGHNDVPARLQHKFTINDRVDNTSATVHAETNVILASSRAGLPVGGASLYITDPPCPNCAKNIAAAGVKKVFIDQKGFEKDWASRRGRHYQEMSLPILAAAGIDVFSINHETGAITRMRPELGALSALIRDKVSGDGTEILYNTAKIPGGKSEHEHWVLEARRLMKHGRELPRKGGAVCLGRMDGLGDFLIKATNRGWREVDPVDAKAEEGKYSFIIDAETRLLMLAAREGLSLENATLYSSGTPSPRCMLHLVAAGVNKLFVGYEHAQALRQHRNEREHERGADRCCDPGLGGCYLDDVCETAGLALGYAHTVPSHIAPPETPQPGVKSSSSRKGSRKPQATA